MQPLFTISTSCYFNTKFSIHPGITPPPRNHTPGTGSPRNQSPRVSLVSEKTEKERKESSGSSPQTSEEVTTPTILTSPPDNTDGDNLGSVEETRILSGGGATHLDVGEERIAVHSSKKKSILGKAKKGALKRIKSRKSKIISTEGSPEMSPSSSPVSSKNDLREDGNVDDEELDNEEVIVKEKTKDPPKFLPLKSKNPVPLGNSRKKTSTSSVDSRPSSKFTPSDEYLVVSMVQRSHSNETEDIAIHQIKFDVYSQNLCVANVSGHTLVLDFSLMPCERKPQVINS